nr:hypothetical protein [Pirellula staleyi]
MTKYLSATLVGSLLLGCSQLLGAEAAAERPLHEIHRDLSQLLKGEVASKSDIDHYVVVTQMCELHAEMVSDSRFTTSDTLKNYRAQLYTRLLRVQTSLKNQLARDAKKGEGSSPVQPDRSAAELSQAVAASVSEALERQQQVLGSRDAMVALGGAPVPADHGRELVELIERTINPAFWDVNGGPGTIVYYAPLQCLVVRATSDMHGRVGNLAEDLRAAGR